jgi:peptidoglycan-N-acetylmuramic acid deacetylase
MKYKLISLIFASIFIFSACSSFSKDVPVSNTVPGSSTEDTGSGTGSDTGSGTDTGSGNETDTPSDSASSPGDAPQVSDAASLDSTETDWYYLPKTNGVPSGAPEDAIKLLNLYGGYYLGDTSQKVIYLTFDEGYENGYTSGILDVLKANDVKAAFFVTRSYIANNPALVRRMAEEGHLVCNHSSTHPSMPQVALKGKAAFDKEFQDTEAAYTKATGKTLAPFFRPPEGKYSELSLYYTRQLGYRTVFWSFAYRDWDTANQPSEPDAIDLLRARAHNGGIFLLHAVSKTNAAILDTVLKEWKSSGYEFGSLYALPEK